MPDQHVIVVVSGLPRSGTSMLMGMLSAGGMPLLVDENRPADAHNPRGYFEYLPVKRMRSDATWMPLARGRAVKIISFLLPNLPTEESYRIVYLARDLDEVLASQAAMLGEQAPDAGTSEALRNAWRAAETAVSAWLGQRPDIAVLRVNHAAILAQPQAVALRIADFVGHGLDTARMAAWVDQNLHRQRKSSNP